MDREDNYWRRRTQSNRLNRRTFIGGAAAAGIGAASLGLVGCGDDNSSGKTPAGNTAASSPSAGSATASGSATSSATPKAGGSYSEAFTGPFAGVDPHNSVYGGSGIVPEVYNYLVRDYVAFAPEKGIMQDLAESQSLQDDKVTWVFKIRPGVKIAANSHGVPVRDLDSSDVLASWQRIKDPASGSNGYAFANQWIDKIDAPDASTFRMIMKAPYAWTIANVGNNLVGAIVPKEWLANADLKKAAVGGGPFTLTELVESDHATMVKNPAYYKSDKGIPYLDKYSIRAFADLSTERTAFTTGQVDVYYASNQDEAKDIVNGNKSLIYRHGKSISYDSFWMHVQSPPWNDERVRNAVNMAIDRSQFIQIVGHGAGEPIGPITYAFEKYALSKDELAKAQPFNVADAKKAFEAAGVSSFTFSHPTSSNVLDYVNVFVRNMSAAGVTATPQALDAGTWVAQYYTNKLTASLSLNQQYQTPDFALQWYVTGGITGNHHYDTGYSDPSVDAAVKKSAGILDEDQRAASYKETQKLILSKAPPFINFFGLYEDPLVYPYIHNYPFGIGSLRYAYMEDIWTSKA